MKTGMGRNSGGNGSYKRSKLTEGYEASLGAGQGSKGTAAVGAQVSAAAAVTLNGKIKAEHYQSDREAFLNAFEKPTQIYRYIRSRTLHSPSYLNRSLSYMKQRNSRNHKRRASFKVDNMLAETMRKLKAEELNSGKDTAKNFYNIILLGLSDADNNWIPDTKARVEIQIARICLKKRKEVRVPINKAFEGSCDIKVQSSSPISTNTTSPLSTSNHNNNSITHHNSHLSAPPPKLCPVISVPSDCFNLVNGHVVRSYVLMVRVSIPKAALVKAGLPATDSPLPNGPTLPLPSHQPVSKKTASVTPRVTAAVHNSNNGVIWPGNLKAEDLNPKVIIKQEDQAHAHAVSNGPGVPGSDEPKPKRRRSAPRDREQFIYTGVGRGGAEGNGVEEVVYMGQITIYDKQLSINLGTADYELILRQCQKKRANFNFNRLVTQEATWEILESDHPKIQIFPCSGGGRAKLNVAIRTSAVKMGPFIERPMSLSSYNGCGSHLGDKDQENGTKTSPMSTRPTKVIYQFIYNNNSRQQTEAREDLSCPWCSLNCLALYSLLKHLKLCHPRFHFAYVPVASGARIDVSINDSFDGSYSGSAYDLVAQPPGEAFARNGPTKRTNIFSILVCHPQKTLPSLSEFQESEEKDVDHRKTFITGHNRLYHHTTTCLPIQPREIDVDSEGEPDPEWLQIKTSMMIDEFTDVNEGEKELMKMWNLHVLKHNYVGDCQIPLACEKFVEYLGREVIKKNLYRNFILHLTNLYDFGLLSAQAMYLTVQGLHGQMKDNNTANSLRESWRAHLQYLPHVIGGSVAPPPLPALSSSTTFSSKFGSTKAAAATLDHLSNLHLTATATLAPALSKGLIAPVSSVVKSLERVSEDSTTSSLVD